MENHLVLIYCLFTWLHSVISQITTRQHKFNTQNFKYESHSQKLGNVKNSFSLPPSASCSSHCRGGTSSWERGPESTGREATFPSTSWELGPELTAREAASPNTPWGTSSAVTALPSARQPSHFSWALCTFGPYPCMAFAQTRGEPSTARPASFAFPSVTGPDSLVSSFSFVALPISGRHDFLLTDQEM